MTDKKQDHDHEDRLPAVDDKTGQPSNPARRRFIEGAVVLGTAMAAGCAPSAGTRDRGGTVGAASAAADAVDTALNKHVKHVIVVYCENRAFNNLFADFPGLAQPLSSVPQERRLQRDRDGSLLPHLPPIWNGLIPKKQTLNGKTVHVGQDAITGLPNGPWELRMPDGSPLSHKLVTHDLIHVFYRNQLAINGGRNDGFVAWGDSGALVMGRYVDNAKNLKLWGLARQYTLCDNFFMGAFGGSFLNHQYLICARPPMYPDADHSPAKEHIVALEEDSPLGIHPKLADGSPTSALHGTARFATHPVMTPDFFAVNTIGPPYAPGWTTDPKDPRFTNWSDPGTLPPQDHLTIGDMLSAKGIDWAWYSGAWQMALDGKGKGGVHDAFPFSPSFQPHHQAFNYFRRYAPGTQARRQHIRDAGVGNDPATNHFLAAIRAGKLPTVSFYEPQGSFTMHAGYTNVADGDNHVARIVDALRDSPLWKDTVLFVTVDENGGWWDHVAPPKADRWGPGTRIPALVISPFAKKDHVEHTVYDTGSIQRFINRRFGLDPLPGIALRDVTMRKASGMAPGDMTEALDFGTET